MIKTIVFDFGNVLIDWSPYYLYSPYFRNEETCRYFVENVIDRKWFTQIDKGNTLFIAYCKTDITEQQMCSELNL
jgi:2-haloacid dehalogenase